MKKLSLIAILFMIVCCNSPNEKVQKMQATIDSLQKQLKETYKPGLGEFMLGIQLHHAKLWFAGQNQNWSLADFEVHEIRESLDDIQKYCSERSEVKAIGMIDPAIDSVNSAVQQKNSLLFNGSFNLLTTTCNRCHKATAHEFNVVTIPTGLPVVNQEFNPNK